LPPAALVGVKKDGREPVAVPLVYSERTWPSVQIGMLRLRLPRGKYADSWTPVHGLILF